MNKTIKYISRTLLIMGVAVLGFACSEDETTTQPVAGFIISEQSELETGYTITFISESTDAVSYLWSFGDGTTAIGQTATNIYLQAGDYEVTLEASGNGFRDVFTQTITIAKNNSELYYLDNDNGELRKLVIGDTSVTTVSTLPGFCLGLTYDSTNQKLYYGDDDAGIVYGNSLAGDAESEIASGLDGARGLAVDESTNTLYFAERFEDRIVKVELLDNTSSTLYSLNDNPDFLEPVGLDLYDGNLYATAIAVDSETIWKASLDGSGITRIIDFNAGGFGYSCTVDEKNEILYFQDDDAGSILSAQLDGSGIEKVGTTTDRTFGIVVFNEIGKLFWVGRDGIVYTSNLDGTDEETFIDLETDVRGLALIKI